MSDCRYTYGQPVRGRADISISLQPSTFFRYVESSYRLKRTNVEVSVSDLYKPTKERGGVMTLYVPFLLLFI